MFLGPELNYPSLEIDSYGQPITGLIDLESLSDGQVLRYLFAIEAGPAHHIVMTVEAVPRD